MNQNNPSQANLHKISNKRSIKITLITIVIVAVGFFTATYYTHKWQARHILREAKDIQLTIRLLQMDAYAHGKEIRDTNRENGFSTWAENEIRKLIECEGDMYLVYQHPQNETIMRIIYKNKGYTIELASNGDVLKYTVYKDSMAIIKN